MTSPLAGSPAEKTKQKMKKLKIKRLLNRIEFHYFWYLRILGYFLNSRESVAPIIPLGNTGVVGAEFERQKNVIK